jgi:type IV secretory pathway VirD2 relaxase
MRWTRGRHQFIVASHTNTNNPHVHIIYNSINLNHDGKYQDFKRSAIALRRVSDQLCLEHGLSVIEYPKPSKGYNRNEYLGENKPPTVRDRLRDLMDTTITTLKEGWPGLV